MTKMSYNGCPRRRGVGLLGRGAALGPGFCVALAYTPLTRVSFVADVWAEADGLLHGDPGLTRRCLRR